jgi:hypothetical protein
MTHSPDDTTRSRVIELDDGSQITISGGPGGDLGISLTDADIDDEERP